MNQHQVLERPLAHATVTVLYVNPAKDRKKSGSIKDTEGQYFGVYPNMLGQFEPGATYEVEFTEKIVNGVMYRDIKRAQPVETEPVEQPAPRRNEAQLPLRGEFTEVDMQPQRNGATLMARAPQQPQARPQPQAAPPAQPKPAAPPNGYYRPTAPKDARRMFLTATLGKFIETGRIGCNAQEIADAIGEILAAYDHTIALEDQVA